MASYAANTSLSSDKSRAEIERTLQRYGASGFMYGRQSSNAVIGFQMKGKTVKFLLPLPDKADKKFWLTPGGRRKRNEAEAHKEWEQSCRQKWRALALAVKAKLEAVESKIAEFESEFLPYIVLASGKTVGEVIVPQLAGATRGSGRLMLGFSGKEEATDVEVA